MKTSLLKVTAYEITEAPRLDSIRVFIEECSPTSGRLTIGCFGESWENYWQATGSGGFVAFLKSTDSDYLLSKMTTHRLPAQKRSYVLRIIEAVKESLSMIPSGIAMPETIPTKELP